MTAAIFKFLLKHNKKSATQKETKNKTKENDECLKESNR